MLCTGCCEKTCYHHIRGGCCVQDAVKRFVITISRGEGGGGGGGLLFTGCCEKTCYHHIRGGCCVQGAVKRLVIIMSGRLFVVCRML